MYGIARKLGVAALTLALSSALGSSARAGSVAWLDEVVQKVIRESAQQGARSSDQAARTGTRLFRNAGDESLDRLARQADELLGSSRTTATGGDAALDARFDRMLPGDATASRTFRTLAPAEKRVVVELGETAHRLARRTPGRADEVVSALGVEGLTAVRVYGDDVAEVIAAEGPKSIDVLRKTGRPGWKFYTETVLRNKGKLAAAGVLTAYLANPDLFVDSAGRATQYAVEQFAKAGLSLAQAVGTGAGRGVQTAIADGLSSLGMAQQLAKGLGMLLAALLAVGAALVLLGLPLRWMTRPIVWPLKIATRALRSILGGRAPREASFTSR